MHKQLQKSLLTVKAKENPNHIQHVCAHFTGWAGQGTVLSAPQQETLQETNHKPPKLAGENKLLKLLQRHHQATARLFLSVLESTP